MGRYLFGIVCAALFFIACGGGSEPIADIPIGAVPAVPDSPLEAALGFASEPGRRQYQLIEMQRTADAQIVECMGQFGFFYAVGPVDESLRRGAFVGDGTRDWTSVHGLGITTSFVEALDQDGEFVDAPAANLEYVSSLDDAQATTYDQALVGVVEASEGPVEYQPAGCWGAAFTELVGRLSLIAEFGEQLDALNSRLNSDPRVRVLEEQWAACMDGLGYRYATQQGLVDDIYARLLTIELTEVDGTMVPVSQQAVDDLLIFEQNVGLASFDCREEINDELSLLRNDYESEFLDDNRFRLDELISD